MKETIFKGCALAFALIALQIAHTPIVAPAEAQDSSTPMDGSVHVPAFDLPLSGALSPEAKQMAIMTQKASGGSTNGLDALPVASNIKSEKDFSDYVKKYRETLNKMTIPFADATVKHFNVKVDASKIDGVPVETFEPDTGVAPENENRVLINLHGGAFMSGAVYVGRVESASIAGTGKFRVISVDYREGYENKFPAASEDVAKVYRHLLEKYPAKNIGIYGCSAGGSLTGQAMTWFMDKNIPLPGAIGIFGSGLSRIFSKGDGYYFSTIAAGKAPPPPGSSEEGLAAALTKFGYYGGADMNSPLVTPANSAAALAKFPPTLLITATRAPDLSSAIVSQRALSRVGVEADLHVWDGLGHCFIGTYQLPEAQEANAVIVSFFDHHLGK